MKKYISIIILLLVGISGTNAQTFSDDNFVYTAAPKKKVQSSNFNTLTKNDMSQSLTYFDGLGRPIQTAAINQGGTNIDVLTPIEYDGFGRQLKEYLPYPLTNSTTSYSRIATSSSIATLNGVYNTAKYENTINPFSEKRFEPSPLNRVLEQAAPGNDWAMTNTKKNTINQTNIASDAVELYKATATWQAAQGLYDIAFSDAGSYAEFELYKTVTFDENSGVSPSETAGSTVEFKNKEGKLILKRTYDATVKHDTYYVYDIYGNLTYVIPPKADTAITQTVLDGLCYQYKYDSQNRLVEKKLPGKQWEFIVYDKLDRVVATGPANSPFSDTTGAGWMITKYDAFGRAIYTGWSAQTINSAARKTLQDAQNAATVLFETKQTTGTIDGIPAYYSNSNAPTSFKLLTVNYYDNYVFPGAQTLPSTIEGQTVLTDVKTLATGNWTRVLTTAASIAGGTNTLFYDEYARLIQTYSQNFLTGYTITNTNLDFAGKTIYTLTKHKRTSASVEIIVREDFTYSAQDRLLTHTHQINGGTIEVLADNTYDELGQLISKKVGTNTQKINYAYNIRGWLTDINDTAALQKAGDPKDLFAFKINYNKSISITGGKSLYNGNIAETFWASTSVPSPVVRGYAYQYDNLNRLKASIYKRDVVVNNAYDENLTYDKNGNIISIIRNGNNDTTANQIDNLTFSYLNATTSNQLAKVVDNAPAAYKGFGFMDSAANTVDDYSYDANGNIIKDNNKNITSIIYNHLNLPTKITFATTGNIVYIYNAIGGKVQKIVTAISPASVSTTDYLGGYQYNTISSVATLKFFPTVEGYVEVSGSSYKYIYQYKDHLGNTRLSYDKSLVIQEENNYYPFGLKQLGYNSITTSTNDALKYKYNGKELQEELGLNMYDYGWRNYMPDIGRWTQIDPLFNDLKFANDNSQVDDEDDQNEVYMSIINDFELGGGIYNTDNLNPYGYGYNNPVSFDDPDGRCPSCIIGGIIGAAVDYGTQVASNYIQGKTGVDAWTDNINLSSIALSAAEGALTQGGSALRKVAIKGAVMAVNNIVEVKTSKDGIVGKVDTNGKNIIKNIAVDAVAGKVLKGGGDGLVKGLAKAGVTKGAIAKATKTVIRATGNNVTRATNQSVKKLSKEALKQTAKSAENVLKSATLKPINDAKDKTNG
jgi:RHS repeat-associated protein